MSSFPTGKKLDLERSLVKAVQNSCLGKGQGEGVEVEVKGKGKEANGRDIQCYYNARLKTGSPV